MRLILWPLQYVFVTEEVVQLHKAAVPVCLHVAPPVCEVNDDVRFTPACLMLLTEARAMTVKLP